jgi:hypothetical protein
LTLAAKIQASMSTGLPWVKVIVSILIIAYGAGRAEPPEFTISFTAKELL